MVDLRDKPRRYTGGTTRSPGKIVLLRIAVVVIVLLSGCGAYVTDLAATNETTTEAPSPLEPESSNHTGYNQSDDDVSTPDPLENKTPRDDVNVTLVEGYLAGELNDYRSDEGLNTITRDSRLATIARRHSYDMAKRDFFGHENPDGQDLEDRLDENSYRCNPGAENIHRTGWMVENRTTEEQLAYESMLSFMESAPHNENMLVPRFTTVGIGIYVTEDRHVFVTMLLCK